MCDRRDYWQWHRDPLRPMARRVRRRNDVPLSLILWALVSWAFVGFLIGGLSSGIAAVLTVVFVAWCWLR